MTEIFVRSTRHIEEGDSVQTRFEKAVLNTGNYFFEEAVERQMPYLEVAYSLEELPQRINRLVLSMSNFISPASDLSGWCEELESRKIDQIVMIGAGAQAWTLDERIELQPPTRRFLDLLADKSETIGVRGYFTAEVLDGFGIRNVDVIGCPTAFWHHIPHVKEYAPADLSAPRLAVHVTPSGHFRESVGAVLRHGIEHGADYVVQSEAWMMPYILPEAADLRERYNTELHSRYYTYGHVDLPRFEEWARARTRIFFGMEPWIDAMRGYDLVYGGRFHGNMAAIMAGVPALNMPSDTRTREMIEFLNLPHMPLGEFHAEMEVGELASMADFSLFATTYPLLRDNYISFLARNGLHFGKRRSTQSERAKERSAKAFRDLLARAPTSVEVVGTDAIERELALRLRPDPNFTP